MKQKFRISKKSFVQRAGIGLALITLLTLGGMLAAQEAGDRLIVRALKYLSEKGENKDYINFLRAYQYTMTDFEKNKGSLVLTQEKETGWARMAANARKEAGLTPAERGKYLASVQNRSPLRIARLWESHKGLFYELVSRDLLRKLERGHRYSLKTLIEYRNTKVFTTQLGKLKSMAGGNIWSNLYNVVKNNRRELGSNTNYYNELHFWYRRDLENNSDVVFEILKEIQAHYN